MKRLLLTLISGLSISLLGALPLGTLNVTALNIAASDSWSASIWFAIAVIIVEMVVVRFMLFAAQKITWNDKWSIFLFPLASILLMYLGVIELMTINNVGSINSINNLTPAISSPFLLGLVLSSINPLQFPYWIGWNKIMLEKGKLIYTRRSISFYIAGIGIGTFTAMLIFITIGHLFAQYLNTYQFIISVALALIYIAFSVYLAYLFFKKCYQLIYV